MSNVVQSDQTYNQYGFQDTQQLDNITQHLDNNDEMLSNLQSVTNNSIQDTAVGVEIDNQISKIDNIEGGRCNETKTTPMTKVPQTELTRNESEIDRQEEESEIMEWDFNDVIDGIDSEMVRLGWKTADGINYLKTTYGVKSRYYLSDEQLIEFWHYLKAHDLQ